MKEWLGLGIFVVFFIYWMWWCSWVTEEGGLEGFILLLFAPGWMWWQACFSDDLGKWYICRTQRSRRKAAFKKAGLTEEEFKQTRDYLESRGVRCRGSES